MDAPVDVVIPVKELRRAKSRLVGATRRADPAATEITTGGAATGVSAGASHQDLALALAADTLAAVLAAGVRSVTVVSPDPRLRDLVDELWARDTSWRHGTRVHVVADDGAGLDAAVGVGARAVHARIGHGGRVAALQADLPALRPAELDAALADLRALGARRAAFVADHTGEGTTMLIGRVGALPEPHFGPGSAAAHAGTGAVALDGAWPGLRLDVDTPDDLRRARTLGVGPATRAWLDAGRGTGRGARDRAEACGGVG